MVSTSGLLTFRAQHAPTELSFCRGLKYILSSEKKIQAAQPSFPRGPNLNFLLGHALDSHVRLLHYIFKERWPVYLLLKPRELLYKNLNHILLWPTIYGFLPKS